MRPHNDPESPRFPNASCTLNKIYLKYETWLQALLCRREIEFSPITPSSLYRPFQRRHALHVEGPAERAVRSRPQHAARRGGQHAAAAG